MVATNNSGAKALGDQLRQVWGSNQFTTSQQRVIAGLGQPLLDKKLKPVPHLTAFFSALVSAKTGSARPLTDAQTDQFLEALTQTLAHDPPADVAGFLVSSARLLGTGNVYRSGFNGLRLLSREGLSFAYRAGPPAPDPNATFDAPAAPPKAVKLLPADQRAILENKPAPKAAPKAAAKAAKSAPKKKRASDGWDSADPWAAASPKAAAVADDGWGPPINPPKPKAKPRPVAKAGTKASTKPAANAAAKPAANAGAPAQPEPTSADFDQANQPFVPSAAAAYDAYVPPVVSGAVVELKDAELVMSTPGDSLVLHKVNGVLSPRTGRVVASSAQLAWTIQGQPVAAELGAFDFESSKPEFTAQPVTLTYPARLLAPAKGALSYKSIRRKPGAPESPYPRFISLTNDVVLRELGSGLSYRGGLSMAGRRLASAALDGSPARLTLSQGGQARFRAVGRNFVLGDSVITSPRAAVALYEGVVDSITHPGVELKYTKRPEQLKLLYSKGPYRTTAYSDSYHQVDIGAQMVLWNLAEPNLEFSIITTPTQVTAPFESKNFFSNVRYQQLKTINRLHPLQLLVNYSNTHGRADVLNLRNVAEDLHVSEANLRSAASGLARDGYVDLLPATGEVLLLRKGRHYVGSAREKKDYDHLVVKSLAGSGRSATLNLTSNQLLVRGVKQFSFSADTALYPVMVRPDSGVVRFGRNRNLRFGGRVTAAIYGFKGKDFEFNYDGFYVEMPHIDSLTIRRKPKKGSKIGAEGVALTTKFTLTNKGKFQTGRLYLNDPGNRSGRIKMPKYPTFTSSSGAFVYFSKPDVLGGVYDSTTYFDVPPFSFDSMATGRSTGKFIGTFHSPALPPIKTSLTTQEDGSMGFVHIVPKEGYALYGGKGRLNGGARVELNSRGLQADGTMTYVGATLRSDRFVMYNDSLTGVGKSGSIAGPNAPKVVLPPNFLINWGAKADSLHLRTPPGGAVAKVYGDHTFKGSLLLTPKVVGGAGRLDGPQSYVRSKSLVFTNDSYTAGKALLSIKSTQAGKPALIAPDMNLVYDLKRGYANFTRDEASKATIELPFTDFRSSLSAGRWDFKRKRVLLRASGADSLGAYLSSTLPEQFGLKFRAETASYDLAKYKLQASGVPYVAIADSWVLPDSGKVAVLPGGKFQRMQRAKVLMDSVSKFHELYLGNLTIKTRVEFEGQAKYTFKYANGDSVALTFSDFRPDSSNFRPQAVVAKKRGLLSSLGRGKPADAPPRGGVTLTGAAKVADNDKFNLAPRIGYRGEVTLNSQRRGLAFQGEIKLNFSKNKDAAAWVAMKDTVNPKSIAINLEDAKGPDGAPLVAGLFGSEDPPGLYPLYFGSPPNSLDVPVVKVDGTLRYDTKTGIYSLSRLDPTDATQYEGAALTFNEATKRLTWRGPLELLSSKKNFTLVGGAVGSGVPDSASYRMRTLLGFDIEMPPKAIEQMAANLTRFTKGALAGIGNQPDDIYNVAQVGGNQAATRFADHKAGSAPDALQKLSPKLLHTLVLNQAELRWDSQERAWYSVGRLGLGGVGKQPFNAMMEGLLEIKRQDGQDYVELYLEPSPGSFYYFRYEKNILVMQSLDEKFNYAISSKMKYDPNTATEYGAFLGDLDEVESFRTRFRKKYLGESAKAAQARRKASAAAEAAIAAEKAAEEEAAAAAIEAKKNKKRKPTADDDPTFDPGADPNAKPAADPAASPVPAARKKKKSRADDPFGDGVMDVPAAPAKPAPAKAAPAKGAPANAAAPGKAAPDKAAAPAKQPATAKPVAPTKPAADSAATAPLSKKQRKAQEKEKAAAAEPDFVPPAEPATEPAKKSKKKKKAAEEDPFGN